MNVHESPLPTISTAGLDLAGAQARWEAADLIARRGREAAPDLLRGRAAELACSPMAREQLVAIALECIARDLEGGGEGVVVDLREYQVLLPLPVLEREAIRTEAQRPCARAADLAAEVARAVAGPSRGLALEARELIGLDAALNAAFWCDRRLAADHEARVTMLASVTHLHEQARQAPRPSMWRRFLKLFGQGE